MRLIILAFAFRLAALAQVTTPEIPYQPDYMVAFGGSYSHYETPPVAAGWLSVAVHVADKTYSLTTLDMTKTTSSLRTGVARVVKQAGNWTLSLHADGGLTIGGVSVGTSSVTVGSWSGGGMLLYDLGGVSKRLGHTYAIGVCRVIAVTANRVSPVFEFGFGKSF